MNSIHLIYENPCLENFQKHPAQALAYWNLIMCNKKSLKMYPLIYLGLFTYQSMFACSLCISEYWSERGKQQCGYTIQ